MFKFEFVLKYRVGPSSQISFNTALSSTKEH